MFKTRINYFIIPISIYIAATSFYTISLDQDKLTVILPLCLLVLILSLLIIFLWNRDGAPPYFDIGVFCILMSSIYVGYPILAFFLSDLDWTPLSDARLQYYHPTSAEFSEVAWWGVIYILIFSFSYVYFRRFPALNYAVKLINPKKTQFFAIALLYLLILAFEQILQILFQVDLNPSYRSPSFGNESIKNLPLILQQITGKLQGIRIVFEWGLVLILIIRINSPFCRWFVLIWALVKIFTVFQVLGGRSSVVFFLLAGFLSYLRTRPLLRPFIFMIICLLIFIGAMVFGFIRDIGVDNFENSFKIVFSMTNEFQALFATGYDIIQHRKADTLPPLTLSYHLTDILRPIPQQLLPFEKIDQSEWYLDLIGQKGENVGYMFGVISESAVGFGLIEIVLRAAALGYMLAKVHNWYCRKAVEFWPTLFYIWLTIMSYYSYRAGTFYLIVNIITIFFPAYILSIYTSRFIDLLAKGIKNKAIIKI